MLTCYRYECGGGSGGGNDGGSGSGSGGGNSCFARQHDPNLIKIDRKRRTKYGNSNGAREHRRRPCRSRPHPLSRRKGNGCVIAGTVDTSDRESKRGDAGKSGDFSQPPPGGADRGGREFTSAGGEHEKVP